MALSKPLKIIIGLLTLFVMFFPFVVPIFMVLWAFSISQPLAETQTVPEAEIFGKIMLPMLFYFGVMVGYAISQVGLQIFYVVHTIKNRAAAETSKILFVLGTYFLPFVTMPVYFLLHVWKDAPAEPVTYPGKLPDEPAG